MFDLLRLVHVCKKWMVNLVTVGQSSIVLYCCELFQNALISSNPTLFSWRLVSQSKCWSNLNSIVQRSRCLLWRTDFLQHLNYVSLDTYFQLQQSLPNSFFAISNLVESAYVLARLPEQNSCAQVGWKTIHAFSFSPVRGINVHKF